MLVRCDAIAFIELPEQGWSVRDVSPDREATSRMTDPNYLHSA